MSYVSEDPWVNGWLIAKYDQAAPLPMTQQYDEWLSGFQVGCAEVGEHHLWPARLAEHLLRTLARMGWDAID